VIAVIGILAAIASTAYIGTLKKAARSEAYANLQSLRILEEQFFAENACYQPLVAGACPVTNNVIAGAANIKGGFLPGFQPGGNPAILPDFALNFTYEIRQNMTITNISATNQPTIASSLPTICFTAVATGVAGTRVAGDLFAIDCNNNRNF
jgi:type II secretory pathway pseudopilin PulG